MKTDLNSLSLDELQHLVSEASKRIEDRKKETISSLAQKWKKEAAQAGLTVEEVLGVPMERGRKRAQNLRRLMLKADPTKVYTKGPHPGWLKDALKSNKTDSVEYLIEIGVLLRDTK